MAYQRANTNCALCGKPLPPFKKKYCSNECLIKAHRSETIEYIKERNAEKRIEWAYHHGKRLAALKTVDEIADYVYNNFIQYNNGRKK